MKQFACRDIGMDCDWRTEGRDENEIFGRVSAHGRDSHGISDFTSDLREKVRSKIRDVKAA